MSSYLFVALAFGLAGLLTLLALLTHPFFDTSANRERFSEDDYKNAGLDVVFEHMGSARFDQFDIEQGGVTVSMIARCRMQVESGRAMAEAMSDVRLRGACHFWLDFYEELCDDAEDELQTGRRAAKRKARDAAIDADIERKKRSSKAIRSGIGDKSP